MKKVLIFRLGSIGDTVVALPALHSVSQYFQDSQITVLTNFPITNTGKECSLSTILNGALKISEYVEYPIGKLDFAGLILLRKKIRALNPDVLVYLMPTRTFKQLVRDWIFFRLCGIKKIIGLKFSPKYQTRLSDPENMTWEHESKRLGRLISEIGTIDFSDASAWDINLNIDEENQAAKSLGEIARMPFIVFCIGTKVDSKDWGEDRWLELAKGMSVKYKDYAIVMIGSHDEYERSERMTRVWLGPKLNLCGELSPRVSAAVIKKAVLYLGHDSGPMHLAASVGVPVVAIFSARNKPGEWYPNGKQNTVLYSRTSCFGCDLNVCVDKGKQCLHNISVQSVLRAVDSYSL